jgi:hypothetical protein
LVCSVSTCMLKHTAMQDLLSVSSQVGDVRKWEGTCSSWTQDCWWFTSVFVNYCRPGSERGSRSLSLLFKQLCSGRHDPVVAGDGDAGYDFFSRFFAPWVSNSADDKQHMQLYRKLQAQAG